MHWIDLRQFVSLIILVVIMAMTATMLAQMVTECGIGLLNVRVDLECE